LNVTSVWIDLNSRAPDSLLGYVATESLFSSELVSGVDVVNLTAYLKANKAEFEFIEKATTHHAVDASRESGIPLDRIVKTIVFVDSEEKPLVAVVRADCMVSRHKLELCSGTRKLQIASDAAAERATGFPTGGIPPVGHRKRLPVYVDNRVLELDAVWCGGGTRTRLVHLTTADIIRLSGAEACDIAIMDS
jgi:Cys-tRNA(Pro) deacylase